jgi:hypothetical protein
MNASRLLALGALALLAGCTQPDPPASPGGTSPLLASVQASTFGSDSAVFSLQVTNTSSAALTLNFNSGQEFDFVVMRGTQEVWRWAGDRMFTQALRSETLAPGETETYTATWAPLPGSGGEYTVRATLMARNAPVEQTTRFRL